MALRAVAVDFAALLLAVGAAAAGAARFVDVGTTGRRKCEFRPAKAKAAVRTAVNKRHIG